ncbi:MAG: MFS transporter [Rhodospirillales bacterium]|nr:MFS transporter [Rhodospirillales bacterium]
MEDGKTRKSALAIAMVTSFVTPFMGASVNIALPSIERDFPMNAVLLSWVATAYLLAAAVALVPAGRLADIHGRKRIFTVGMITFTVFSLLIALSTSGPMLIAFRVFQGFGSGMIFATGTAILMSVFPKEQRGKVLGINVAAVYVGLSMGPFLGGILTQYLSWRGIFVFILPLCLLSLGLTFTRLKGDWAEARGEAFDLPGALIYALALICIMWGVSLLPGVFSLALIVPGIVCMAAFVVWEMRVDNPVLRMSLFFENRVFALSSLAAMLNYSATFAVAFLLSLYLQHLKGMSPQAAGLVLVAQPVMMAIVSPLAGRLSDRIEPRIISSLGMACSTTALIALIFLNGDTPLSFLMVVLAVFGTGLGLFTSPNTNAIMSSVDRRFYGIATGIMGTMRLLGQMVSMGIATLIFAVFMGRVRIAPEHYPALMQGMKVAFAIFATLCILGIFASLTRGRVR